MIRRQSLWFLPLIISLLCSCGGPSAGRFRVGTWKTAQTIQPFFYHRFLPAGHTVRVFPFTNPADQKAALLSGDLDMCGTTIAHAIHSASRGEPVVIVALLCHKASALVVGQGSGIQSVRELRGKRIGYVPGTMHEILLREVLSRNGLAAKDDVSLVRVDFFDMGTALAKGDIDAFLSGEPFPTLAVSQGYGRVLVYPYFQNAIGDINAGMLVTRERLRKQPDRILTLVKLHIQATRYLRRHRSVWLSRAADFGTPLKVWRAAADNISLTYHLDQAAVRQARALGKQMLALGIIEGEPDYDTLFQLDIMSRALRELDDGE